MEQDYAELAIEAEQTLDAVDRALARLRNGTYWTCEQCGVVIDEEHLSGAPTASTCAEHMPAVQPRLSDAPMDGQPTGETAADDRPYEPRSYETQPYGAAPYSPTAPPVDPPSGIS